MTDEPFMGDEVCSSHLSQVLIQRSTHYCQRENHMGVSFEECFRRRYQAMDKKLLQDSELFRFDFDSEMGASE